MSAVALAPLLAASLLLAPLGMQGTERDAGPVREGRYEHPRMRFSVDLGGRWAAYDHRHAAALDAAIPAQAPKAGTPMHDKRWTEIYAYERSSVVDSQQGAYLLPEGDWVPPGSEMRILITTRTLHCPSMDQLQDRDFQQRLQDVLTSHHLIPGSGQEEISWEPFEARWLDAGKPQPELPTGILRGQLLRTNGERLALYYQILPGGGRFHRIKAVCRAEALPLLRPELERLVASFGGLARPKSALWAEFMRYLPIGAGLLIVLLFLQQRRIRRDAERERQSRLATTSPAEEAAPEPGQTRDDPAT